MLLTIISIILIVLLYVGSSYLNQKTAIPIELSSLTVDKCGSCNNASCTLRKE